MKIVIAPDSFKGSLSSREVAASIERGIKRVLREVDIVKVPMADGGEGTLDTIVNTKEGKLVSITVKDPLFRDIKAEYGIIDDGKTAIIEMARASGLTLLRDDEKNPLKTSTYGTGQMIRHAIDKGCRKIIICIGGSATNDGGVGMAAALGAKFLKSDGNEIWYGGGTLGELSKIDLRGFYGMVRDCEIYAACDVTNHLCGENGASRVYGPQKGATPEMVEMLDKNLQNYGKVLEDTFKVEVLKLQGGGAAGGMGAGLYAFLGAKLEPGINLVIDAVDLREKIMDSELVITGEGMMDSQTANGKTPFGVAQLAKEYGIPVIAIAGGIGKGAEVMYDHGITSMFSIVDRPMELKEAMRDSRKLLENVIERIMRTLMVNSNWSK